MNNNRQRGWVGKMWWKYTHHKCSLEWLCQVYSNKTATPTTLSLGSKLINKTQLGDLQLETGSPRTNQHGLRTAPVPIFPLKRDKFSSYICMHNLTWKTAITLSNIWERFLITWKAKTFGQRCYYYILGWTRVNYMYMQ